MPFHDYAKLAQGACPRLCLLTAATEPFDEALDARVKALSEEVDANTERVVECRRRVPTAFAAVVARRAAALTAVADAREDLRRQNLRKARRRTRYEALSRSNPLAGVWRSGGAAHAS